MSKNDNQRVKIRIIFHGEADSLRGTGHLVRAVGMAVDLKTRAPEAWLIETRTNNKPLAERLCGDWQAYQVQTPMNYEIESLQPALWSTEQKHRFLQAVTEISRRADKEILISDNKYALNSADLELLYGRFEHVILVDNISGIQHRVDAVLFPNDYTQISSPVSPVLSGHKYNWMNPGIDFVQLPAKKSYTYSIFMGGADPNNLTLQAIQDLVGKHGPVLILTGAAYPHQQALLAAKEQYPDLKIEIQPARGNFLEKICQAEICLVAFGLSSIEVEQLGEKLVLYTHHPEHLGDAQRYLSSRPRRSVLRKDWLAGKEPLAGIRQKRPDIGTSLFEFIDQTLNKQM